MEAEGDIVGAAMTRGSASLMAETAGNALPTMKTQGASFSEKWVVEVYDETLVPSYINAIKVRDVNISALNKLAQQSEGRLKVEGVRVVKDTKVSVRK